MPTSTPAAQQARHRLGAISSLTEPATPTAPAGPAELAPARGWRERWWPASLRGARADPGRRGVLALAGVAAVAAVLAAVGVWQDRPVPETVPNLPAVVAAAPTGAAEPPPDAATDTTEAEIVVSVAGAVQEPGLVTLPAGARVADAVVAAGGALPGTDLLTLNLAQVLGDGEQVLVGVAGPPVSGGAAGGGPAAGGSAGGPGAGGPVDLNTADAAQLEELPGVGPVMAGAILDFRAENEGFSTVEQLMEVSGIGDARFAQLKDLVSV